MENSKNLKSSHTRTEEFKYSFTIYYHDRDKYFSDFYTFDGIKEMKKRLDADGETYELKVCDENFEIDIINI